MFSFGKRASELLAAQPGEAMSWKTTPNFWINNGLCKCSHLLVLFSSLSFIRAHIAAASAFAIRAIWTPIRSVFLANQRQQVELCTVGRLAIRFSFGAVFFQIP